MLAHDRAPGRAGRAEGDRAAREPSRRRRLRNAPIGRAYHCAAATGGLVSQLSCVSVRWVTREAANRCPPVRRLHFRHPGKGRVYCTVGTRDRVVEPPQSTTPNSRLHFGLDRWRRRRVTIRIAVLLEYTDCGKSVSVPAHTVWVNDEEALLVSERELPAGLYVVLKQDFTGERQAGSVVPSQLKRNDGFYLGLRFDAPAPGFWHIVFPGSRA
jgi:hypothetical protein